ncbi:general secretion pathway protein GspK [Vitiosangium sp. GDMCC 1.1324]|uniref:general secretion pathway protein GspK n=1 Tax=Vitiosangium sp. (strain GDMCC 1.1324) TaxID=2138576 RepID=UPI000D394D23|nr:type II secretion system protein GspK [Vitiosangium sp. GDMCC 1.1324]PTL80438.1 general secretion pathway protein GspK [Vitiosangium sp. GDMCC 1.1324]
MTSPQHTEARRGDARRDARANRRRRGVALIIAVVAITILTVVATEFAYNTRVDLQLAANQRDEVQAMYMARSGVALSRLLLRFQKQVDQTPIPNIGDLARQLTGGAAGGQQPASTLNIQLWKLARVDCHMLKGLVPAGGADGEEEAAPAPTLHEDDAVEPELSLGTSAKRSFGSFSGCFLSTISDEEEKLNLNRLNAGSGDALPTVMRLVDLLEDKRFEFLFSREDANRVRANPRDVVIAIKDWIDEDKMKSGLDLTNAVGPFANGFSDEGSDYSRYEPRYEPKNARFDSMDELYRIHGVNDRFMAAFRDRLTVYPDVNSKPNVNTDDPMMMYMAILSAADPARPDPRLKDPVFVQELITRIRSARAFSFFGTSVADFVSAIETAGIAVNPALKANVAGNRLLGDKSTTFTIKSVGEAGSVQKTITAVVRLDDGLGKLLYWREE